MTNKVYDIIIIGSGMGGLMCADLLAREGYSVIVLEKNKQIGGCLQTYVRDKVIFDSGVHYLGGLEEGQNLYQVFKYIGIMDQLKLERMDMDAFDKILIENDPQEYPFAQGYENFIARLLVYFPKEEEALRRYCDKIKEVCARFPLYNLRAGGSLSEKMDVMEMDTRAFIESITNDTKLQSVLVGNSMLYAGVGGKTPFYVHAMILNSYIESSWKCINGGSQIARLIAANIRSRGGVIQKNCEVKEIVVTDGKVSHVLVNNNEKIEGKFVISNIHPAKTLAITPSPLIKTVFRNRIASLENSVAAFTLNIVFKEQSFPYLPHNYYYSSEGRAWDLTEHTEANWPLGYVLFFLPDKTKQYASAITVLTYMRFDEVKQWAHTFNTVSEQEDRGAGYEAFKQHKTALLLDCVAKKFPGIREAIHTCYSSTPLSYRDYIGTGDGAMYGIARDSKDPNRTFIGARTKLPNLYFTGQNLNLHGILGTTMSALVTCIDFMGNDQIIQKIKDA